MDWLEDIQEGLTKRTYHSYWGRLTERFACFFMPSKKISKKSLFLLHRFKKSIIFAIPKNNKTSKDMNKVTKTFDGKRFQYFLNGKLYKNSTRDFQFACVATEQYNGKTKTFIISLGNKKESTYNSMARFYARYCDLEVVTIVNE